MSSNNNETNPCVPLETLVGWFNEQATATDAEREVLRIDTQLEPVLVDEAAALRRDMQIAGNLEKTKVLQDFKGMLLSQGVVGDEELQKLFEVENDK